MIRLNKFNVINRLNKFSSRWESKLFTTIDHTTDNVFNSQWNSSNTKLYKDFLNSGNKLSSTGAFVSYSGKYCGRVPNAKRIVSDKMTKDIWWGDVNIPMEPSLFDEYLNYSEKYVDGKTHYIIDAYAGWLPEERIKIRIHCFQPYHALFMKNMLIPSDVKFDKPDYEIFNLGHKKLNDVNKSISKDVELDPTLDECLISLNLSSNKILIFGTEYAGEMKKSIFSVMMFIMQRNNHLTLHSSANISKNKDNLCLFLGLSGTGKTSISTDKSRILIGDDEHVWHDNDVFNIEGGCYAKCVDLKRKNEPEIYDAVKYGSVLENVIIDENNVVNYNDTSLTQNTRCSYPLKHIENVLIPATVNKHPDNIIFLTCDAFGVLPPISKLTLDQAFKFFVLGFTSKVSGTEEGVTEPEPTFSSCFGEPFIVYHPFQYGKLLMDKVKKHNTNVWLVNTGWVEGQCGKGGKRIDIKYTRSTVDYIHNGDYKNDNFVNYSLFNLQVPQNKENKINIPDEYLQPNRAWKSLKAYNEQIGTLYDLFKNEYKNKFNKEF